MSSTKALKTIDRKRLWSEAKYWQWSYPKKIDMKSLKMLMHGLGLTASEEDFQSVLDKKNEEVSVIKSMLTNFEKSWEE